MDNEHSEYEERLIVETFFAEPTMPKVRLTRIRDGGKIEWVVTRDQEVIVKTAARIHALDNFRAVVDLVLNNL